MAFFAESSAVVLSSWMVLAGCGGVVASGADNDAADATRIVDASGNDKDAADARRIVDDARADAKSFSCAHLVVFQDVRCTSAEVGMMCPANSCNGVVNYTCIATGDDGGRPWVWFSSYDACSSGFGSDAGMDAGTGTGTGTGMGMDAGQDTGSGAGSGSGA